MARIGIIGLGNMGESIAKALMKAGLTKDSLRFIEAKHERKTFIEKTYGLVCSKTVSELTTASDHIILAVKPQDSRAVMQEIAPHFDDKKVLISIMAGVTTANILAIMARDLKIVRIMPNISVKVGAGVIGLCSNSVVTEDELAAVEGMLKPLGRFVRIGEELMDAFTALGGSGPAFFLLFLEAMIDAGVKMGLTRDKSKAISLQVVMGTAKMLEEENLHPTIMREMVTSPGGTTIEGIATLEERALKGIVIAAIEAARPTIERTRLVMMNSYQTKRQQMISTQLIPRGISDRRVIEAVRKVPRHLFLDEALWPQAYEDHPLPIGEKQTMSQPYMVAIMTEALQLTGTKKILEIGTGSGYQAAILAELADQVYTIERIHSLAKRARKVFDQLQYRNIVMTIRDGSSGWKEYSPFDGIIVTAAAPNVPMVLLEQVAPGGRLVIPIGDEAVQDLMVYAKDLNGEITKENYGGCRFVKLVGEYGWKT